MPVFKQKLNHDKCGHIFAIISSLFCHCQKGGIDLQALPLDSLMCGSSYSVSRNQIFKTCHHLIQNTALITLHISCTQYMSYLLHYVSGSCLYPLKVFSCFYSYLVVLPSSALTAPLLIAAVSK